MYVIHTNSKTIRIGENHKSKVIFMFCKYCGAKCDDGVKFCSGCGKQIGEDNEEKVIQPSSSLIL